MRYLLLGLIGGFLYTTAAVVPAAAVPPPSYPILQSATSSDVSYNWAGYVAEGGTYHSVSGSWVVPTVTPAGGLAADATWVGIGGVVSDDLLQAGTQAIVDPGGAVSYEAWFELMPGASEPLPVDIAAGDRVSVSITERSAGQWDVSVANHTNGQRYSRTVVYGSSRSSREWVEEMPSTVRGGLIPLDSFGAVHFLSGPTQDAYPLVMVNHRGDILAQTSVQDSNGGFTVTRTGAQALRPRLGIR